MVKVAVTQQEPVWFDLAGSVDKTCRLIQEAASNGADMIAFPEVWIPGYPMWIWERPLVPSLATRYIKNSLSYDSDYMKSICDGARKHNIAVVLGFSENDNNSLYIAQCIISKAGEVVVKRRKLKPTHMERTVFGDGYGKDLSNVADLDGVGKVGALSCWEHLQPLLKYHTMGLREQLHVAAWPPVHKFLGVESEGLWSMSADGVQNLSQTYAAESATFVLHCTAVVSQAGIDAHNVQKNPLFGKTGGGHSAAFGPDGRRLTEPIPETQEGIIYAELPLDTILAVRHLWDAHGHYSRPDLLWLGVDRRGKAPMRVTEKEEKGATESENRN